MLSQLTKHELYFIIHCSFSNLWNYLWSNDNSDEFLLKQKEDKRNIEKNRSNLEEQNTQESFTDEFNSQKNQKETWASRLEEKPAYRENTQSQYYQEENNSRVKFNALKKGIHYNGEFYNLESLIEESKRQGEWQEPEWGFPKGRRNYQENDYECALREFTEETGYPKDILKLVSNVFPFEEVFIGSNYKSYKHKYFLTYMDYEDTKKYPFQPNSEVSKIEWLNYEDSIHKIRDYNEEKKKMITKVNHCIQNYIL